MVLLLFKPGVAVNRLDTSILPGLLRLCYFMETILGTSSVTVTSVNEGPHKSGSLHFVGKALDIRSKYYPPDKVAEVVAAFKAEYDREYDLLWENQGQPNEHLHLEFDPHR